MVLDLVKLNVGNIMAEIRIGLRGTILLNDKLVHSPLIVRVKMGLGQWPVLFGRIRDAKFRIRLAQKQRNPNKRLQNSNK